MPGSYRHIVICTVLCLCSLFGKGQEFKKANDFTYQLYQQEKWDSLIIVGDSIISSGLDFYYLRLRVGLAHYFKKQYLLAIPHFQEAVLMNEAENIAAEHLYYCYFQSGQYLQALKVISKQNNYVQQKVGFNKKKYVQSGQLRAGYKSSNSEYIPAARELDADVDIKLLKSSNLKLSINQIIQRASFWDIKQRQLYLGYSLPLKQDWNIHLGFSALSYDYNVKPLGTTILTEGNQWVGSIALDKFYLNNQIHFGMTILNGDSTNHHQLSLGYTYFPKGNSSLFAGLSLYGSVEENLSDFALAFKPYFGFKLGQKTTFDFSYLKGGGHNLVFLNGELVNNNYDITSGLLEAGVGYQWHPKWSMSLFYNLEFKQNDLINDYHYNSLFINLKFTP